MFVVVSFWIIILKVYYKFFTINYTYILKDQTFVAKGKDQVCCLIQEEIVLFLPGQKDCYRAWHPYT